jgi:drug/metabolite transporter, DME family
MSIPGLPAKRRPMVGRGWLALDGRRRGYLLVLLATLSWSTSGTFIKLIVQHYGLGAFTLAFWRDLMTFGVFVLVGLLLRRPWPRITGRDLLAVAVMGAISIGIFHVSWVMAVTMIPVAVATVLNYTAPAFVVLFAWLVWRETPTRRQTTALVLALAGILLVTGAYNLLDTRLNWPGLLVGLSTGITYGSFTLIGKHVLKRYDALTVITYAFGFATLTLFILRPGVLLDAGSLPAGAWVGLIILVLVSTAGGFGLYTAGLKHLSASTASITATLEPVIAASLAFLLLGEIIEGLQIAGGVLVILAVILLAL